MQNEALLDAIVAYYGRRHAGFVQRLKSTMDERKLAVTNNSVLGVADEPTPVSVYPVFERFLQQDPFILAKSELGQIFAEHSSSVAGPVFDSSLLDVIAPDTDRLRYQVGQLQRELRNLSSKYFYLSQTKMEQFYSYLRLGGLYIPDYVEKIARRAQNTQECVPNAAKIGHDANTQTDNAYSYFAAKPAKGRYQTRPTVYKTKEGVGSARVCEDTAIDGNGYELLGGFAVEHSIADEVESEADAASVPYDKISESEQRLTEMAESQSQRRRIFKAGSSPASQNQLERLMSAFKDIRTFQDTRSFEDILSRVNDIVAAQQQLERRVDEKNGYISDLYRQLGEANRRCETAESGEAAFREGQGQRSSCQANALLTVSIAEKSSCTDMPKLGGKSIGNSIISMRTTESAASFYFQTTRPVDCSSGRVVIETDAETSNAPDNEGSGALTYDWSVRFEDRETQTTEFERIYQGFQTEISTTDVSTQVAVKLETRDSSVQVGKEEKVKQAYKLSLLLSRGQIDQVLTQPVDKQIMTESLCTCDDKAVQMSIASGESATYTQQKMVEKGIMTDVNAEQRKLAEMTALQASVLRRKDQLMQIIENNALDATLRKYLIYLTGSSSSDTRAADKPVSSEVRESNYIIYIAASPEKKHGKAGHEIQEPITSYYHAKRKVFKEPDAHLGYKDYPDGAYVVYKERQARYSAGKAAVGRKNGGQARSLQIYPAAVKNPGLPSVAGVSVAGKRYPAELAPQMQVYATEKKNLAPPLAAGALKDESHAGGAENALVVVGIAEQRLNASDDVGSRLGKTKISYRIDNEKRWNSSYRQEPSGAEDETVRSVQVMLEPSASDESISLQEEQFERDLEELRLLKNQPIPELYIGGEAGKVECGIPDALKAKKKACAARLASLQCYNSQKDDSEPESASQEQEQSAGYNLMDNFRYTPVRVYLDGEAVGKRLRYRNKDLAISEDAEVARQVVFDENE